MTSSQARTSCPAFAARSARSFRRSGCPRKPNRPRPGRTDPDRKPDTKDEAAPLPVMMLSPWRLLVLEAQRTISAGSWFGQGLLTSPAPPCPVCKLFPFLFPEMRPIPLYEGNDGPDLAAFSVATIARFLVW